MLCIFLIYQAYHQIHLDLFQQLVLNFYAAGIKLNVKLEKGFISFKNYFKQIPVPFKIYADSECILKKVESNIVNEYNYCRKVMKKYFCKNLIMSSEEKERFVQGNISWICNKLINGDEKVRDHYHVSGKYSGAAQWNCNINLR